MVWWFKRLATYAYTKLDSVPSESVDAFAGGTTSLTGLQLFPCVERHLIQEGTRQSRLLRSDLLVPDTDHLVLEVPHLQYPRGTTLPRPRCNTC